MAASFQSVIQIAPEFAGLDKPLVDAVIAMATRRVDPVKLVTVYDDAVTLLTAHLLTLRLRRGDSGAITAKSVGEMAIDYSAFKLRNSYMQTAYGVEYWELVRSFICNPMTV